MSALTLSMQDKRELERTTRVLALKVAQIIVESRSGEKVHTECKGSSSGADWFNLAIQDSAEVSTETRRSLREELISSPVPLCIEISVRTDEGHSTVLETWSLGVLSEHGDPTVKATNTVVYNRMGTLLKSLLTVSRMTPAYKISRGQGPDSYVICYRIFMGEPQLNILGDNNKHIRVGQVRTPVGTIHLSVSYRTKMTFSTIQRNPDNISVKSDHFQEDSSPRNHNEVKSKSVKVGAFVADKQILVTDDEFLFDIPFNSLLLPVEQVATNEASDGNEQLPNNPAAKPNSRDGSRRSSGSITSANDQGFIFVELKGPFTTEGNTNTDVGSFYRSCLNAPPLQAFVEEQTVEQQLGDVSKIMENFETSSYLYDNFVDSLCKSTINNN